ncbi:hypothetical protein [Isoptericola haloaureus]|uniref:Uncharacterized protein n=1 Tax=Isoptericola haloaureus TaxID=1542902 RepID=A0ABU7Z5L6_9MICO
MSSRSVLAGLLKVVGVGAAIVVALAAVLLFLILHHVNVPENGDRLAQDLGRDRADEIAEILEPRGSSPVDAENLAARAREETRGTVVLLGWSGDSGTADGAVVEMAIPVRVGGMEGGWFDAGRTEGMAVTCWRFVVHAHDHDGRASRDEFGCPSELHGRVPPDPTPLPSLGPDAEATVLQVLDGLPDGAGPRAAEAALRGAFPEFVDVAVEEGSEELVAAVGVRQSRDCVVGIAPDDEPAWRYSGFDRILLEPGEGGCGPYLYLRPVTTH